ncbi:MAG: hypothetical protein KBS69_01025 [Bacteroidales bacterium]|nr:hypothetical protein [Candidatus Colicola caccequi]
MKNDVNRALVAKKKFCKISLTLLAGLLLTFAFPVQAWAGGSTTYYARLKAQVSGNSSSMGMVYANTSNSDSGTYGASSTSANQTTTTQNEEKSFYAFAKPNPGYMFEGWSASNNNRTIASTDNPYNVKVKASSDQSGSPTEKIVYAVFKEIPMATITYKAPTNGSYTYSYSGDVVTMNPGDADKQKQTKDPATLAAMPADGYVFLRWKKTTADGVSYFGGNPAENVGFDKDATVEAEFVPDAWALFVIRDGDGAQYADLNEVNTAALASTSKTIVVAKDGELIAGNYTISSTITLVVPFESTGSKGVTKPVALSNSTLPISLYRKLTLLPGVNITLQGKLAVAAQVQSGDASHNPCGFPVGPVGCLDMSKGGHIDVENGGTIYAWGFIKGQDYLDGNNTQNVGTITAKNGSTIKECYGAADWGGGSYAYAVGQNSKSYRIYPFQGYFVQNIEVPLRMEYGAKDYLYCNVYAASSQNEVNDIPFIGNTSGVLFKINGTDGAVTKWYDPTTDHLVVELEGNAALDNLQMSIYITINANQFDLPILSNMHLKLKDCQLTLSAPMKLQPGAILEIPAGSSLTLKSKLYVYDHDQWGKYVQKKYFKTLPAILTQFRSRGDGSTNTLDDAQIICDGAIIMANGGGLYTTASGANVMGNNGGTIQWESSLPANSTTYGYTNANGVTGSNFSSTLTPEFCDGAVCTPAKAHNENDSYTAAKAGTTFTNVQGRWFGGDAKNEKTNHTYDFTYLNGDADVTTEAIYWLNAAGEGHWNNATTTDVTYLNTWKGTEEEIGITAYYTYTVYDQDNNPQDGWIKLTQVGETENFGGSDNNMYVYIDDKWQSIGSTDSECLYTVGGVRQALVGSTLVAVTKNTIPEDGAWHATATPTNYYVDLSSGACIWTPATKVAGVEKAYVIEGTTYLRYDMTGSGEDWMAVEYQAPYYYTVDEQNLRTYYEYNTNTGAWQQAAPKLTVTDEKGASQSFFFLADAIATANSTYNPTITLLADVEENATSEWIVTSTVKSTKYTINLNGHTATLTRSVSGTSTAGVGNRFLNITSNMAVKIIDLSAEQNGQIRCLATGNAYARGITVTDGTLTLESGKLYVQNDAPYASNSSERAYGVVVAAGKTFTMNGGEIEAASEYYGWCIVGSGSATTRSVINMNGGVLNANAYYNAEGIYSTADVNMAGGTINAKTCPLFSKTSGNQYAYGIYVNASPNATEADAYHGKLTMTGGTINAYAVSNYAYGVYVHSASATMTTSKANISSAEAVINGGTINAESKTTTVYGVYIYGGPNSYSKMADVKTVINNATVNATGTNTVYGIFVNATVADLNGGLLYGIAEINDCNVTATSTSSTKAYGVYVTAASRMMNETTYSMISASNKKTWCFKENGKVKIPSTDGKNTYTYQTGYYACGGKATINGGTFTAITKTYNAYGAYCAASTLRGPEDTTTPTVEGRGTLIIHGGTFNGKSTTYNSYGVFSSGTTTIDGGTFNATPGTYGAYGAYADRGTMNITGGTYNATAETTTACGIGATGWIDTGRGIVGHAVVTVNGVVVNAKTKTQDTAYGVLATATTTELNATKYADRSESDRNYYYTPETNAVKANYYLYRFGNYAEGGELIVNGGTFNVEAATTTALGAYCAQSALVHTTEVGCTALGQGTLTINGGTFVSETKGTTTAECVRSYGNTAINNGTFTATAKTTTVYGVRVLDGTTTVNGGTFNAIATTTTAYGIYANAEVEGNYGYPRAAIAYVNGGTFNVETKGGATAYGAFAQSVKKASFKPSKMASASTVTEDMALAGQMTITDGTFNVKASNGNTVYGINVAGTQTQGSATASAKAIVEGGKFNINGATTKSAMVNTSAKAENFSITGGHYSADSNLSNYVAAPNRILNCQEPELKETYPYEVAEGYKVTFKNGSTILQEGYVKVGTTPSYTGTPTKSEDAQYTYTFNGWTPAIVAVTGDATYTATYTQNLRSYTITWQDENGVELSHETVNYGVVPTHAALTKDADAQYTYTWKGWNATPVAVTGDATYKSLGFTQTKKSYTLTWNLDGGTITTAGTTAGSVEWGTSLNAPVVEKTGYTFAGWTPTVPATMPTENATYTAQWQAQQEVTYTVNHYYESALGVKEQKPFRTEEKQGKVGEQVSAEDVLDLDGYDSPAPSTQIIAAEGTVVDYYYKSRNLNVTDNVVIAGANLDQIVVENTGALSASAPSTTKRLVLTATPGNNDGANADLTNITISESVCIEIEMNSTRTMDDKLFYCFSVPFNVNVNGGVERLNETNDNWESAELNTNYRVYTYNEADRAINGRQDSNWKEFNGTQFLPGVFYLCEFDNSNYNRYRFYAADKTNLNNKGNIAVTHTGDATNGGWNGVANNGLTDNQLSGDFTLIQTLNSVSNSFESAKADEKPLAIGNAAMVQVSESGSVVVGETPSAVAARRMGEAASTEFVNVRLYKENQDKHVDQIFIRASEDAAEQYAAGIDLSKATMGTPKVARMWVNDYDLQLVANEARMNNNQAIFSLGMSAPANGEYIIALNETPADAIVYLTMNGSAIWNLNIAPAPISLSKGTEDSYGLRLVRKINNVVTGLDEAVLNGDVQKVILNDHLYIIRDGKVYSAHGHVIK